VASRGSCPDDGWVIDLSLIGTWHYLLFAALHVLNFVEGPSVALHLVRTTLRVRFDSPSGHALGTATKSEFCEGRSRDPLGESIPEPYKIEPQIAKAL
jgi:hypothetical protein